MDKAVKVSVGIPFYNAEKYLAFAIRSVINQTFSDWELILADDGSTDNSLEIARSFADPRIRVFHDNANRGISFRLNQIISESRGQYIARMDADDIAFPGRLEEQVRALENDPLLDLVDSKAIVIDESNEIIGERAVPGFTTIRQVFNSARFIHPTVMFRKSFIEKYRYDSEFDGAEDQDLWIRSFKEAKVGKIHHPLYFYREAGTLNLKTYISRSSKLVKLYETHRGKIPSSFYHALLVKIWLKKLIYASAFTLRIESFLIRQRNVALPKDKSSDYLLQLQAAIRN